ncbi:MAG: protein TolB [Candidatus Tectimicrobiota bacterium]|nr:MAG: protein TolB [Candidatus Tectomicrobia bacterium]
MPRRWRWWAATFLWLLASQATPQTRVYIDIDTAGGYLLPVAIPRLLGEAEAPQLGQAIRALLRRDLELSGFFRVLDPATYLEDSPASLDRLAYENWLPLGAVGVIVGRLHTAPASEELQVEFVLHDVVQRRPRRGKTYRGPPERYWEMVHRFSDVVFHEFTGEAGPFDTRVLCVAPRRDGTGGKDIVLMDYDGHGVQPLVADGALNVAPVLSPDGTLLAYTSYRHGHPDLYLRDLRRGTEERLTSGAGLALPGAWSPDGRYLALSQSIDGDSELFLYDRRTRRWQRLTSHWGIDVSPSFAPDGRRLVFTSDRSGTPQLYLTDLHGRPPVRLTYEGSYNTAPAWAPRGETIAFVGRSPDGALDIYTIQADGTALRRLTHGGGLRESPTWAPNGRFVMYTSREAAGYRRYLARADGQTNLLLPEASLACESVRWVALPAP